MDMGTVERMDMVAEKHGFKSKLCHLFTVWTRHLEGGKMPPSLFIFKRNKNILISLSPYQLLQPRNERIEMVCL